MMISLLPRLAPGIAAKIEAKLLDLIRGFTVLKDGANLAWFGFWSISTGWRTGCRSTCWPAGMGARALGGSAPSPPWASSPARQSACPTRRDWSPSSTS
jgi:hypothetical protein